jgi:hypothetical protein
MLLQNMLNHQVICNRSWGKAHRYMPFWTAQSLWQLGHLGIAAQWQLPQSHEGQQPLVPWQLAAAVADATL